MSEMKPFKPYNGNEKYMFVSYNHDDADVVYEIISDFDSRGYRLWYDTGICVGDNFVAALAERIKNCEIFLCFLSPRYIESPYCKRELNFALSNHKKIIPIKTENFKLPDSIAFALSAINWTNLTRFPSEKELVDFICENNQASLLPCREETGPGENPPAPIEPAPPPPPPPPPPPRPKWLPILLAGVAVLVLAGAFLAFRPKDAGGLDQGTALHPEEAVSQESAAVPEEKEAEATPEETALPAETADKAPAETAGKTPVEAISPELLASSGQKAVGYLSGRAKGGCPLSVYDPTESAEAEADVVYDNAVAAMALLGNLARNKNHSDSDLKQILDSITAQVESGAVLSARTGTKSLAAAAVALLRYDRERTSFAYVRSAQTILDWVLENARSGDGGFRRSSETEDRAAADNLWLASALRLLHAKTGNIVYSDAAKDAETFARSLRSPDGSYYLAGSFRDAQNPELLSVETQALAAAVMNDRTGIGRTLERCGNGGRFSPDDRSAGSFSTESTLLMALAFRSLGMEEEALQALAAVREYQMEDGSVPETDVASFRDGAGREYTNRPRTADAAWYAVLAEGYNPFLIAG